MTIRNEIVNGPNGTRWLVREAVSKEAADNAIAYAWTTGSVGARFESSDESDITTIISDVVKINSDGSERQPYTQAY